MLTMPRLKFIPSFTDMSPQIPSDPNTREGGYLQRIVPQELIDYYVKMFHCGSDPNENSDLARHCAFSLPAVALTLGEYTFHTWSF